MAPTDTNGNQPGLESRKTSGPAVDSHEQKNIDSENISRVTRMGTAPIGRLMLEFGIPAVVSVVFNGLYNVIDSIFLGQALGEVGLAATSVATPVMTFLIALSVLAGNGGNALCAILMGEGKKERAEQTLSNTLTVIIVEGIIVAVFALTLLDPVLCAVGATETTLPYAHTFTFIICFGFILQNISMGLNNFIRTAGDPNRALWTMLIGTAVCILLNYLFVMVFGWGVTGSASATLIGQGVSSLFVLQYFIANRKSPFKLRAKLMRPDAQLVRRIVALGMAPFLLQAAAALVQIFGNSMMASLGAADPLGTDGALATIGVTMKITMFAIFPVLGVAIAAQPILGFNVGARNYSRVKRTLILAICVAAVILLIFFICFHVFPAQIVGLFGVEAELLDFAIWTLQVQTLILPIASIQIITSNYFQATGQPLKSTILSLTRQLIFLLPALMIAPTAIPYAFPQVTPLMAFCMGFPIADGCAIITAVFFLSIELHRLNGHIREEKEALHA